MWVEKLPSGRVRAGFLVPGTRRKVQKTFDYAFEAEAWAVGAERRATVALGTDPASPPGITVPEPIRSRPSAPTIADHGAAWMTRVGAGRGWAKQTRDGYATHLRAIAASDLGRLPVDVPVKSHVEQWMTDQVHAGVGVPTINARLKVLRMVTRDALANGIADRDPTDGIPFLTPDIKPARTLTSTEDSALLLAASPMLATMSLLALDAGLRWQEAAALPVDAIVGEFVVVRQVVERSGAIRAYPKGHRSRVVPIATERLGAALDEFASAAGDGLLFRNKAGAALDYWDWRRDEFRPACHRAKLKPRPRFHDLRHTYGSRLAAKGVVRSEIAALMGHADESTTARYIHAGVDGHRLKLVRAALG